MAEGLAEAPSPRPQNQRVGRRILLCRLTMWLHRVARDSGFETATELSKKIENHAAMVRFYFMYYNVPCVHQTLRVTPAMEAGLADPCLGHRRSRRSPLIRPRTYSCASSGYASRRKNSEEPSRRSSGRLARSSKSCTSVRPQGGDVENEWTKVMSGDRLVKFTAHSIARADIRGSDQPTCGGVVTRVDSSGLP